MRFGNLDLEKFAYDATEIQDYRTEPWVLKGAQILNMLIEVDDAASDALLPPAMHAAIPAYVGFNVMACPESPIGPFSIAEVRIAGRAGVRPRSFPLRSYVNSEAARQELAQRWGYPVAYGEIKLSLRHDRIQAKVVAGGATTLEMEMLDREMIGGNDVQYIASMHLARSKIDSKLVLVQVDPEYVVMKAERGKPRILVFDSLPWKATDGLTPTNPISATFCNCDVTLPKIRYVCDPGIPAMRGTRKVDA